MGNNEKFDPGELPGNRSCVLNNEYGDTEVLAKYCGFEKVPKPVIAELQHGWMMPERNVNPEFVVGNDGLSRTRKNKQYLVTRSDQAEYLKSEGYTNVEAIGFPIIYAEKPKIKRLEKSLLVMPVHSLSDTREHWNDEEYASYIDSVSANFEKIVLCLHSSCLKKGNWINAFKKRNIEVVLGADPRDCNTFPRLAYLFNRFEFVTSNQMGSHIAYAAYFGAKPSIAGPEPRFDKTDYENTVFYRNVPEMLILLDEWYKTGYFKKLFSFLYCEPHLANQLIEWAEFQLGEKEKKSRDELRNILGWSMKDRLIFELKNKIRKVIRK
ncbi:MAG: hypothetical protein IPF75_04325 [Bacteroidetes bacterium]|nr:hypothetical protein [Bacteroidota bacterium]